MSDDLKIKLEQDLARAFPAETRAANRLSETERREIRELCVTKAEKDVFNRMVDGYAALRKIAEDKIAAGSPRSLWQNSIDMDYAREASELRSFRKSLEWRAEREALGLSREVARFKR